MIELHRAIVSLSGRLCTHGRSIQDRIVFFQAPSLAGSNREAALAIERILHAAWHVDTAGWCQHGYIYNIDSERELVNQGMSNGDLRLFEIGSNGFGPYFARAEDVDCFVTPRLRLRLDAALRRLEAMQQPHRAIAA